MQEKFIEHINLGYTFKGPSILVGSGIYDGSPHKAEVRIPLKTMNRHGLIAGATGTGKTVTLQVIAEQLSHHGVPVLLMDLKGDLSGVASAGTTNKHIVHRHSFISGEWEAKGFPVELLTLSDEPGARLRATVSEFGPVLVSKILNLNDTQGGIISLLFKYCDDNKLPLIDLKDLRKILQFSTGEGKEKIKQEYGAISSTSVSTIMRKIIELEQQGADRFFGEMSFDVEDLLRKDKDGNGFLSILRLTDIQDKPKLFSTFMLCLLAEIYSKFPEQGDSDRPKLCIFIDEAHLIFKEASRDLKSQLESIVKLIRSKGVGIYFCTQNPTDIPDEVLSQLGLKVQHALRAFTAKDRKAIKRTAENYPISPFYKTDEILTSLGIGEALITALNEKGIPTPLAATLLRPPMSRMGILDDKEIKGLVKSSAIAEKYNEEIDRESAFEILSAKIKKAEIEEQVEVKNVTQTKTTSRRRVKEEDSMLESLSKNTMARQIGRTVVREVMRGLLGVLGIKR